MFTDPELARVGLSEGEAQRLGVPVRIAKLPVSAVLRTLTTGESKGFMKALVAESDDRILGFTMIGAEADGTPRGDADGDIGEAPLSGGSRRHFCAPHNGGGPRVALLEFAQGARTIEASGSAW